jgi:hypothetical protein
MLGERPDDRAPQMREGVDESAVGVLRQTLQGDGPRTVERMSRSKLNVPIAAPHAELCHEPCHVDCTFNSEGVTMQFDAFEFVQCVCRKVTFPAMRTGHQRDIFDDE